MSTSFASAIPLDTRRIWTTGRFRHALLFLALSTWVGLASALDGYLNLRHPVTPSVEENPMAKWILVRCGNEPSLLVRFKVASTVVVMALLWALYRRWEAAAWPSVLALSVFQFLLLNYMTDGLWRLSSVL
jgi:hypothetical protein